MLQACSMCYSATNNGVCRKTRQVTLHIKCLQGMLQCIYVLQYMLQYHEPRRRQKDASSNTTNRIVDMHVTECVCVAVCIAVPRTKVLAGERVKRQHISNGCSACCIVSALLQHVFQRYEPTRRRKEALSTTCQIDAVSVAVCVFCCSMCFSAMHRGVGGQKHQAPQHIDVLRCALQCCSICCDATNHGVGGKTRQMTIQIKLLKSMLQCIRVLQYVLRCHDPRRAREIALSDTTHQSVAARVAVCMCVAV